ncbi:MAG: hypothetical protein LUH07_10020, partial [Lachnospiraceae bacterium]|nr:hypothetical protein [Lachnospiraceae bacterium]
MMHKKALLTVMLVFLCLGLNGCGSTAGTNTTLYFTQLSDRLSNWGNRAESEESQSQEEEDDTNRLSIPDNFQIDEGGNFTFTEVDGADHYLIFVYDALEPDGEYLF